MGLLWFLIGLAAGITALLALYFFYLAPARNEEFMAERARLQSEASQKLEAERAKLAQEYEERIKTQIADFRRANEQIYTQAISDHQKSAERNLESVRSYYESKIAQMTKEFEAKLETLKDEYEKRIAQARKESAASSRSIVRGIISEQLAPFLPGFEFFPGDCRFLGQPVDYIVFAGMCNERDGTGEDSEAEQNNGNDVEIIFIDVKTGNAQLSRIQRLIRNAVQAGRVSFETFQIRDDMIVRKSVGYRTFVKEIELTNGREDG